MERHTDGRILYHLRRPWPHAGGTRVLLLDPLDFLRRLAALVPAPYTHMVRYHGVFANRSRDRGRLPAPPRAVSVEVEGEERQAAPASGPDAPGAGGPPTEPSACRASGSSPAPRRRHRIAWAQLLLRVLHVDALKCPRCSTAMVVVAFLSDPSVVGRILRHLRLPTEAPPVSPARSSSEERLDVAAWDSWEAAEEWAEVEFVQEGEPIRGARACVRGWQPRRSGRAPPR
jgi:hypothetical protein